MKRTTLIVSTLMAALAVDAQAQSISYNFDNNGTVGGSGAGSGPLSGAYAGVVNAAYWYNDWPSYPSANLVDSTGNATTLSLSAAYNSGTWNANGNNQAGADVPGGTWNNSMLEGYINGTGVGAVSISLSQIPYATYSIYVYLMSDDGTRVGNVTDGGSTYYFGADPQSIVPGGAPVFTRATATDSSGFNTDANYAVFSGLTGASQTISATFYASDQTTLSYGGIAGFQIVAVPEPGTIVLGVFGACFGLAALRRRR